jgi:hypothetical protein
MKYIQLADVLPSPLKWQTEIKNNKKKPVSGSPEQDMGTFFLWYIKQFLGLCLRAFTFL